MHHQNCAVQQRYLFLNEVIGPCKWEAKQIADTARTWPHRHEYGKQAFDMQLKQFWPLHKWPDVQENFIPKLQHENDGLILQVHPAVCSLSAHPCRLRRLVCPLYSVCHHQWHMLRCWDSSVLSVRAFLLSDYVVVL